MEFSRFYFALIFKTVRNIGKYLLFKLTTHRRTTATKKKKAGSIYIKLQAPTPKVIIVASTKKISRRTTLKVSGRKKPE